METKWIAIAAMVVLSVMFGSLPIETYFKAECRKAYAQSNKSVDEIKEICR